LICSPNCALDRQRRTLWRSRFAKTKTRRFGRYNGSGLWKQIGHGWGDDRYHNSNAEEDSMINRIDKFPPGSCRMPENLRMKRKKLKNPGID
jgi:hypothetical protein